MADDLRALVFEVVSWNLQSAWGWLGLVASARGLRFLGLPEATREAALRQVYADYPDVALAQDDPFLLDAAEQVRCYLRGERREFAVELDLRGHTPFELSVWSLARQIPYGQTRTYGWIAGQLAGAGAAQAVGAALGSNPVPLIVPCHRVVGADGGLHGFLGGLEMKARLLALETRQMALPL